MKVVRRSLTSGGDGELGRLRREWRYLDAVQRAHRSLVNDDVALNVSRTIIGYGDFGSLARVAAR